MSSPKAVLRSIGGAKLKRDLTQVRPDLMFKGSGRAQARGNFAGNMIAISLAIRGTRWGQSLAGASLVLCLFLAPGCATPGLDDWKLAQLENNPPAYERFLRQHPESRYVAEARIQLQEARWTWAEAADSAQVYEQF